MKNLIFTSIDLRHCATEEIDIFKSVIDDINNAELVVADKKLGILKLSNERACFISLYFQSLIEYKKGALQPSQELLKKAIALTQPNAILLTSLAHLYICQNDPQKAIGLLLQINKNFPTEIQVLVLLAEQLMKIDQYGEAFKAYDACSNLLEKNEEDKFLSEKLNCLARLNFLKYSIPLENQLITLFDKNGIDYSGMIQPVFSLLSAKYDLSENHLPVELDRLNEDRLFITLLTSAINTSFLFELWLIEIRKTLIRHFEKVGSVSNYENLKIAIAIQNYMNEYVHEVSDEEKHFLEEMEAGSIKGALESKYITRAMYGKPVSSVNIISTSFDSKLVSKFIRMTVELPSAELEYSKRIQSIGVIREEDEVVQVQYEENPYPRWITFPKVAPSEYASYLTSKLPNMDLGEFKPNKDIRVLIAGCGTGKQAISFAKAFPGAKITAIDLSIASLGYAKRKAVEYKVGHIDFIQMSLLDIGKLNKKFDVIECCGVLHHLDDPSKGFETLKGVLSESGIMKVALYSRLARRNIIKLREKYSIKHAKADLNIRSERMSILKSKDESNSSLRKFRDSYTTSGFRDLVFHEREVQVDMDWISDILSDLKLGFIGLDFKYLNYLHEFKNSFPQANSEYDLSNWSQFEQSNPDTFASMYTFWCKPTMAK